MRDVVTYIFDQRFDAAEGATTDGLAGDNAESSLDLVEPGGAHRGKVEVDMLILFQPGLHVRSSVGGQVVQHHMNVLASMRLHGFLEKRQEILTVTSLLALTEDLTSPHIQCREQIRCAVPTVVVSAFLSGVQLDRQHRLSPVQRLDLRLLVHRQHHSPTRRVEVEPDDVGDLLGERWISEAYSGRRYRSCETPAELQRSAVDQDR